MSKEEKDLIEDEEELDLSSLPDDELVLQMHDDLYDGLKEEIEEGTNILLERGWSPDKVLNDALVEGMRIVGIDFRDGILFVPEVLLSANSMKGGMSILRPLLAETGAPPIGTAVIGTVKGDIHDIGKNLVGMMWEGAGFEVFDIGINNSVEKYLEAIEEHQPDILGMSALLTTTMPYMKVVIEELGNKGIRDDLIVLVGGAPLNEEFSQAIGADAYCRDAAVAVETAKMMVEKLNSLGINIQWARVEELAGYGDIGRRHIAKAMLEVKAIRTFHEAFDKYIGRNGIAYIERFRLNVFEAIETIREYHGIPVLAHPGYIKNLDELLPKLIKSGLKGIEVFYANYDTNTINRLKNIASKYGLIPCGGSDYHGIKTKTEKLPGALGPPQESVDRLIEAKNQQI